MRILLAEDDAMLGDGLRAGLRQAGFQVDWVRDGVAAERELASGVYAAGVLDLGLPLKDGLDVLKDLRARKIATPILVLTARDAVPDRVVGLDTGADDYVVKPFKPQELLARIRARLRRDTAEDDQKLQVGDVLIDVAGHQVTRDGEQISLTPLEFDLLVALARKPRQVFTREVLLEQVWGYRHPADTRLVNVHVQRLRAKVEKDPENPQVVLTVRGVGYKAGPP